jgi:hypothetical protein
VGPRAGLDAMEIRNIFFSCCESNLGSPARSLDDIPTELDESKVLVSFNHIEKKDDF